MDGALNGATTTADGAAYSDNQPFGSSTPPATTTLFDLDSATAALYTQAPPNGGTTVLRGSLGSTVGDVVGFDIDGSDNTGYALLSVAQAAPRLYDVDLTSGSATAIGTQGFPGLIDIAFSAQAADFLLSTRLSTSASAAVRAGSPVRLGGRLIDEDDAPVVGAEVLVQYRPQNVAGAFTTVRTAVTGRDGTWTATASPGVNAVWRAVFAESTMAGYLGSTSARAVTKVAWTVPVVSAPARLDGPANAVITGKATPFDGGARLRLQRVAANGGVANFDAEATADGPGGSG